MTERAIDVEKLTPQERLRLLERLWESLSDEDLPPTQAQREELDQWLKTVANGGSRVIIRA